MLQVIAIFSILILVILVHELGHFLTAKAVGVKIQEVGLGLPPRIFAIKRGDTEYSLNILPLGAFVKMLGEEDHQEQGGLASKSIRARLAVLSSGSIMNALLPITLFSLSFMIPKEVYIGPVQIVEVAPNSPAAMAGVEPGDTILRINDRWIENSSDVVYSTQLNLGSEITMMVEKEDSTLRTMRLVPRWNPPQDQGAMGIAMQMPTKDLVVKAYPIWQAIPLGVRSSLDTITLLKNEVIGWFIRGTSPQLTGPIGIVQMTGEIAKAGLSPLLGFAALLSMNLAVINLLPIPMLDGGRMVFVALEGLRRGKRIPPERERFVHLIGFMLLITFMIIISYYDILRILQGESLY